VELGGKADFKFGGARNEWEMGGGGWIQQTAHWGGKGVTAKMGGEGAEKREK